MGGVLGKVSLHRDDGTWLPKSLRLFFDDGLSLFNWPGYEVFVDGQSKGIVLNQSTFVFDVEAGRRCLHLQYRFAKLFPLWLWCSNEINFSILDNQIVHFNCEPRHGFWGGDFYTFLFTTNIYVSMGNIEENDE